MSNNSITDWGRVRVELLVSTGSDAKLFKIQDEYGKVFFCIEPYGRRPDGQSTLLTPREFRNVSVVVEEEIQSDLDREERDRRERR